MIYSVIIGGEHQHLSKVFTDSFDAYFYFSDLRDRFPKATIMLIQRNNEPRHRAIQTVTFIGKDAETQFSDWLHKIQVFADIISRRQVGDVLTVTYSFEV